MAKREPISKKELQLKLYKMGASINLIQMPAVIERLHQEYMSNQTQEFDIGENGEIITSTGIFKEKENSEAEYISKELKINIDAFGMEKSVEKIVSERKNNEQNAIQSITYRKDNKIIYEEPFDGVYFGPYNFEYEDNATPLLDDVVEYATEYQENLSLNGTLKDNMEYLILNYPQTEEWFLQKGMLEKSSIENKEINIPKNRFSRKESEENRLVYYYEQIQKCKQEEEKEEQKIGLLRRFAIEKCPSIPGTKKKLISKMSEFSEIPVQSTQTEKESTTSKSKTVLFKGRKTLDYMKKSLDAKKSLRKNMKRTIISEYASRPIIGKYEKVIIANRLNKYLKEQSKNKVQNYCEVEER